MKQKVDGRIGDKYQLSAVLGQGATGTVYAAKNLRTQRRVAIKSLHLRPNLTPGSPELLRFEQEARIAGSIESPHIVQVFDVEQDPATDLPFLVMEMLRGEDLQSLLDRVGPLPVDVALRIAAQACTGLAAAHSANVIHRDIKPANVFLARQEKGAIVVKLLDFGVAKIRRMPDGNLNSQALAAPAVSMTESGQMLGSPLFMSPEQIDEPKAVDARSDLFSLGTTLFTMLAGKAPHAEITSFHLLLRQLISAPPPSIRTVANWVPEEVESFLEKASALRREDRFQNAKEMLAELEKLLPNGLDLHEALLVGVGQAAMAPNSPPNVKVTIEAAVMSTAATLPTSMPKKNIERVEEQHSETLQSAKSPMNAEPPALGPSSTLQSAVPPERIDSQPNPAPNRQGLIMAMVVAVIVIVAILLWFKH